MAFFLMVSQFPHQYFYLPCGFLLHLGCSDSVLLRRGATRWGDLGITTLFAEATRCQLEYKYLARVTGRAEYYKKVRFLFSFRILSIMDACMQVERIMDIFYAVNVTDGLFASKWFDTQKRNPSALAHVN